jgi:O-antigen/teichoic acid export membrane protein
MIRGLLRNTVAFAASRAAERITAILLSFAIARKLGPPGLGIYSGAMVFFAAISNAAELGAPTYLIREISKNRALTSPYLLHLSAMAIVLCGAVAGVTAMIVPHLAYSRQLTVSICIVLAGVAPGMLKTIQEAVFIAHQRVEFITYCTAGAGIVYVVATLFLLNVGYGVVAVVAAFAAVQALVCVTYFALISRYLVRLHWQLSWNTAGRLIREVKVFAGSSVLAAVMGRPEVVMLSFVVTDAQLGFYSAALRLSEGWVVLADTYMSNVYAVLSRAYQMPQRAKSQQIVEKSIKYLLAIALPLSAGIFVAARPLVNLVYGPGFESSVPVLRILIASLPAAFVYTVLWRILAARDQQHLMLRAQAIMAAARLCLGCVLIPSLATIGGALSTATVMWLHTLLLGYYIRRDGTALGVLRLGWRASVAASGMVLVALAGITRLPLWAIFCSAVAVYAGLMAAMKGVSSEDLAFLHSESSD